MTNRNHTEHLIEEFELLLAKKNKEAIIKIIKKINIVDLAILLSDYKNEKRIIFVELLGINFPANLLLKFNTHIREEFLELFTQKQISEILSNLESVDIISILEDFKKDFYQPIIKLLPEKLKKELEDGLNYPIDSAARLMNKNFLSVPKHWTIKQVNSYCSKNKAILNDNFYGVFIINDLFQPIALINTRELVINPADTIVSTLISNDIINFNYLTDKDDLAISFQKYDLTIAPIVNNDTKLVGYITIDDIIDVVEEKAEEDILHLGGINESDIFSKTHKTIRTRFTWLFINLLTALLASIVIAFFDATIEKIVALAVLMPIVASMGGNAGTQTVTISVRALATKELNNKNIFKVIFKEFLVGTINGLFFAFICFLAILFILDNIFLANLFAIATIITLMVAGLSGAVIPIIISKLKGDPAISSTVILTTITDIVAFLSFLGLATIFIK